MLSIIVGSIWWNGWFLKNLHVRVSFDTSLTLLVIPIKNNKRTILTDMVSVHLQDRIYIESSTTNTRCWRFELCELVVRVCGKPRCVPHIYSRQSLQWLKKFSLNANQPCEYIEMPEDSILLLLGYIETYLEGFTDKDKLSSRDWKHRIKWIYA